MVNLMIASSILENILKRDWINDLPTLQSYVEEKLNDAFDNLGLSASIKQFIIYGSSITEKEKPNDIDIYICLKDLKDLVDDFSEFTPEYLVCQIHELMHPNSGLKFKNIPIDICVSLDEYNNSELFLNIDDVILYKQNI